MEERKKSNVNVWLGAETGILKSVDLIKKTATNHFAHFGKNIEVLALCWDYSNQDSLYSGHINGKVRKFDILSDNYTDCFDIPQYDGKNEKLVSLNCTNSDKFLTCTTEGHLKLWSKYLNTTSDVIDIMVGPRIQCTAFNSKSNLFACGGYSNCLKLWDLNNPSEPVFKAKNVKPDWLQLEVPVNVLQIAFIPDGSQRIFTTTGTHNLRVYDPTSNKRRPILETSFLDHPLTAASVSERDPYRVFVGNTRGFAASFDLRKFKKCIRVYKGFAGSIRSMAAHKTEPYIFSCGLDRHLCVHELEIQKPKYKVYLKSKLNCLLASHMKVNETVSKISNNVKESHKRKLSEEDYNDDDDDDNDEMWKKMKPVSDDDESDGSDFD